MYKLNLMPLSNEYLSWGRIAVIPWDSDIFGFAVAEYEPGDPEEIVKDRVAFSSHLIDWCINNRIVLISCCVRAENSKCLSLMSDLSFKYVDCKIRVILSRLQVASLALSRIPVRLVDEADYDQVMKIAETAFQSGRYHADPNFPKNLADRRYRFWIRKALSSKNKSTRVYVIGKLGQVKGFFHVELTDGVADLRLGAVDVLTESGIAGFSLYAGTLQVLKEAGARVANASISISNTPVMNLYGALGFRFSQPEVVFHMYISKNLSLIEKTDAGPDLGDNR